MAKTQQELLQQQKLMGQVSSGVTGAAALAGQGIGMLNQAKNINTSIGPQQTDAYGRPMYGLGDFSQQADSINTKGATGGEIASGAVTGAQAGAAFGPIGAGVGAVVGAGSSLIFGKRRQTLSKRKKALAQGNLAFAQNQYNSSMQNFNDNQASQ